MTEKVREVEIMDCTLRGGEQTNGVSFLPHEKLMIARYLLSEVGVDRVEVASARVSEGEKDAVRMICNYARQHDMLNRVEVLGFVDGTKSVDWITECGCKTINLLAKGSLRHRQYQLKKTPEQHIADIKEVIAYAHSKGMDVNLYLEDWSQGMRDKPRLCVEHDGLFERRGYPEISVTGYPRYPQSPQLLRVHESHDRPLSGSKV